MHIITNLRVKYYICYRSGKSTGKLILSVLVRRTAIQLNRRVIAIHFL